MLSSEHSASPFGTQMGGRDPVLWVFVDFVVGVSSLRLLIAIP